MKTRAKADAALQRRDRIKTEGGPPVELHPDMELVQSKQRLSSKILCSIARSYDKICSKVATFFTKI